MAGHIVPPETTDSFCRCVRETGGICWDLLVQGIVALPLCRVMSSTNDCQSCFPLPGTAVSWMQRDRSFLNCFLKDSFQLHQCWFSEFGSMSR